MRTCLNNHIKKVSLYATLLTFFAISNSYALTVNNYNKFCEEGKVFNVEIKFNDIVAKYNKYGHYKLGDDYLPTGDPSDPFSNEGDRDMAHLAVEPDTTYKIYGEIDEEEMDYSYYDYEDLTASDIKVYELQAKLEALKIGNQVQERSGYGKYNLRNGKNLIAFIKFAYEFYKNSSGEYRVGVKDDKLFKDTPAAGYPVCPMELLEEYATLNSTSAVELNNGFEDKFKDCVSKWEYIGNKELENSDKIFETLEDIYMGLVYLYPALKVLQSKGIVLDDLDDDDRAAIFSCVYEVKGLQPITSMNVSDEQLTKKFSKIGAGDLIGALIQDEELNFSVAETVYRYMIEIKHKNNPQNLARWVAEYEDLFGNTYEPLDADSYDRFVKAYNIAFAKYGSDVSRQTGLDYVFFGYVEHPELFESKNSLREMTERFANHLRANFSDSAFIRNRDNANYVAKSYMMAEKMCENTGFLDITDIYASDICLVEHSYGYGENSTEYILSDTQVVSLEGRLEEGDFDTDKDEVSDREELGTLEEVNISRLLEAYIKYNELDQEEADKLRATPTVKMYNYISNPVLPDSDFDGRDDRRDRARALYNDYTFDMDTLNNKQIHFDFNMDYRYFFMDSSAYYPELSDMSIALSNMIGTHKGISDKHFKNRNKEEEYSETGISSYLWYIGQEDIEERNTGVVPYTISHREVFLQKRKVNHKLRNIITIVIGEDERYKGMLSANIDGTYNEDGEYEGYHHVGFDIEANKIVEDIDEYTSNQYGTKVFWITGFGSGGSIANLVAQKLTKKKGASNVYAYTFDAIATINSKNIEDTNKFNYSIYRNIFNVINDDNILTKLLDSDIGWYRYGRTVSGSAGVMAKKTKEILGSNYKKGVKGSNGHYRGNSGAVIKVINNILKKVKEVIDSIVGVIDDIVAGFTNTEPIVYEHSGPISPVEQKRRKTDENIKKEREKTYIDECTSINNSVDTVNAEAIDDGKTIEGELLNTKNKDINVADTTQKPNNQEGNSEAELDGYPFNVNYNKFNEDKDKIEENKDNKIVIKSDNNNYVYSNYTMRGEEVFCDVDFTKFWNITDIEEEKISEEKGKYSNVNEAHMHLFDIRAGDFGYNTDIKEDDGITLTTVGSCTNKPLVDYIVKELNYSSIEDAVNNSDGVVAYDKKIGKGSFLTIDGRIIAAFPLAVLVGDDNREKFTNIGNRMHKFSNYYHPETVKEGAFKAWGSDGGDSTYRYVDVVFEKAGNKKHQYVVPFIIIDAKDLHYRPNIEGFFATFVDNRYGQVYQVKDDLKIRDDKGKVKNVKVEEPMLLYRDNSEKRDYHFLSEEDAKIAEIAGWERVEDAHYLDYYPHRDEIRDIKRFSPIEPYIASKSEISDVNTTVRDSLLLTPNDKIVSIRVYKHKFDTNDKRHFLNIRDDTNKIKKDDSLIGPVLSEEIDAKSNIVVIYSSDIKKLVEYGKNNN